MLPAMNKNRKAKVKLAKEEEEAIDGIVRGCVTSGGIMVVCVSVCVVMQRRCHNLGIL